MIKNVVFNLSEKSLEITTDDDLNIQKLKQKYSFLSKIEIKKVLKKYEDVDKCLENEWNNILNIIYKTYPAAKGMLMQNYNFSNDKITIYTKTDFDVGYIKKQKIDKFISDRLFVLTGKPINTEIALDDNFENHIKLDDLVVELPKVNNKAGNKKAKKSRFEHAIKEESVKIHELNEEYDKAAVNGFVFDIERKELKSGKILKILKVTDYSDSIIIKMFLDKKDEDVAIECGKWYKFYGKMTYDSFEKDLVMLLNSFEILNVNLTRNDLAEHKRVELHLHTKMSTMDAVTSAEDYIKRAAAWGHKAIAITDHGVLQSYPEAYDASKKYGVKVIYGIEAYMYDDTVQIVTNANYKSIACTYVVLDIETTGLNFLSDSITEIGAVKIKDNQIIDRFSTFVNPERHIPDAITTLTGITDEMVKDAPKKDQALKKFASFAADSVLVAHNAGFDITFIKTAGKNIGIKFENTVVDTLSLARGMFPKLKNHKLDTVAKYLNVDLKNHHRAVDDAAATADIFLKCLDNLQKMGLKTLENINEQYMGKIEVKNEYYHATILVKDMQGLKNLYYLVSVAHLEHYHRKPRIPKSLFNKFRNGLIIGSACEAGELYRKILNHAEQDDIEKVAKFYDYFEIMPLANNRFLLRQNKVKDDNELISINKKICEIADKLNKLVVATGDVHFLDPSDEIARRILLYGSGFEDADYDMPLYYKTTDEMLHEFSYLGEEKSYEVVVENTNKIADMTEIIKPIPEETYSPKIPGAEEELKTMVMKKAHEVYGDKLPDIVETRLQRELSSIINHGYAVMYIIAQKLVKKSNEDGYLVGSRGSVGSSLVATMSGITEVNPLPPHYVCPKCKYSEFINDLSVGSGVDLPDKNCPKCGEKLDKNGFDIPFEVFLGFDGDKEPDIDLNFSGDYQPKAHKYTEVLFGKGHVFRAGTIGTLAEKTAYGYVKKYIDEHNMRVHAPEVDRLVKICTGVKRTTGQHPGGVMIVPKENNIYEFTPIQHPADDNGSNIITTHFDYHSISGRLLKLDLLGHDVPTLIKMLENLTGVNALKIPLDDKKTLKLFSSTEPLNVSPEDIDSDVGTYGIPENGTKFVRQMLKDAMPSCFSDLVRISGFSHGTDVWLNNAQVLLKNKTASMNEVISTRDSIMLYLLHKGVAPKISFKTMEKVRKGRGLSEEDIAAMKEKDVPDWFIESCKKIKYLFPKAHAVAYVIMAFRIAYFKVYYPKEFYATYFTVCADDFDANIVVKGEQAIRDKIKEINGKGKEATQKELNLVTILELALEMYVRGYKLYPVDIYESDAVKFIVKEDGLLPPLNSLQGLGISAAKSIVSARKDGEFISVEDLIRRAHISKSVIEILKDHGCLEGMSETSQLSLFSMA